MADAEIEDKVEKLTKEYEELVAKLAAKEGQLFSKKDLQGALRVMIKGKKPRVERYELTTVIE